MKDAAQTGDGAAMMVDKSTMTELADNGNIQSHTDQVRAFSLFLTSNYRSSATATPIPTDRGCQTDADPRAALIREMINIPCCPYDFSDVRRYI